MNTSKQEILERLRLLVTDVCGKGVRMTLPGIVLDVIEPPLLQEFTESFNEEFDALLRADHIDEDTTFRDLLEYID